MKQTIFLTGSNGLLGQKIVHFLRKKEAVTLIATSQGKNRICAKGGYCYETFDITDPERAKALFEKYKPQTLIHAAAMTNVDACEKEPATCEALNVQSVRTLIDLCQEYDTHFVFVSTDFVFDGLAGPYREEDKPNPLSVYARSKWEAEKLLQASPLQWSILRTILVYGVVENSERSNVVLWAKAALEKGEPFSAVTDQTRMPTLSEDLASACVAAAIKKKTGIYHVSGKDAVTIEALVRKVAEVFGGDASLIQPATSDSLNAPAKRPPVTGFVLDKAIRELDYQPHSLLEGLQLIKKQLADKT